MASSQLLRMVNVFWVDAALPQIGTRVGRTMDELDDEDDDELNLLAMQMQKHRYKTVSFSELWAIWSLVDSSCYDINGRDNLGVPPILYAAMRGSVVLLRLLLNYHADINAMSKLRETAVIAACRKHHRRAIEFLIKRGARLEIVDRSQFSALRWAATHGSVWMVKLLLKHNVSVTLDSYTTNSALSIAMSLPTTRHAKVTLLLQRKLVAERRQLLQDVVKQKERDEIRAIKRFRRKQLREKESVPAEHNEDKEPRPAAALQRTPFALPIIPSLKKKPMLQSHVAVMAKKRDAHPIRQLLSIQFTPPATKWVRLGPGRWHQELVGPRREMPMALPPPPEVVTAVEAIRSEAAWDGFLSENHGQSASSCPALEIEDIE